VKLLRGKVANSDPKCRVPLGFFSFLSFLAILIFAKYKRFKMNFACILSLGGYHQGLFIFVIICEKIIMLNI
jgi:hypothetical protein